jgi:predicted DNA-binding transcriptional regulator AlpA
MEMPEEMVAPSVLADELGITESALAKWRCDGTGPPFCKLGHKVVRYPRSTVEAWKFKRVKASTREEVSEPFDVEASR